MGARAPLDNCQDRGGLGELIELRKITSRPRGEQLSADWPLPAAVKAVNVQGVIPLLPQLEPPLPQLGSKRRIRVVEQRSQPLKGRPLPT